MYILISVGFEVICILYLCENMEQLKEQFRGYFGFDEDKLDYLVSLFEKRILAKGDVFIQQDRLCKDLAFVKEGIIRVSTLLDGKEITQWIATKGYYITDLVGFLESSKSRWNISALTDSVIYSISKHNYDKIQTSIPEWNHKERQFIIHCFTILENRVLQFLSMSAEERYLYYFQENKELFNQIPQQYIASMLGMTPETLSRIRRKA